MKAKTLTILTVFLLILTSVQALEQIDEFNFELEAEDEVTLELGELSYVNVRTPTTTTITVALEDTSLDFVVESIDDMGTASLRSGDETLTLELGDTPAQFQLEGSRFPVIFIENRIYSAADEEADREVVIKFTVPSLQTFGNNNAAEVIPIGGEAEQVEFPEITGEATTEVETEGKKDPYLKYFLGIIIVLLIIIVILGPKKKTDSSEASPEPVKTATVVEAPKEEKKTTKKKATKKKTE